PGNVSFDGALAFQGADQLEGSCVMVGSHLVLGSDGDTDVRFINCHNKASNSSGGALSVGGGLLIEGGALTVENCSSLTGDGGGLHVDGTLEISGEATATFRDCSAAEHGGAVSARRIVSRGTVTVSRCAARGKRGGGGIYVEVGDFEQLNGRVAFDHCHATMGPGGGLHLAEGSVKQTAGRLEFSRCRSRADGGGFAVKGQVWVADVLQAVDCSSTAGGGGGSVDGSFYQEEPWSPFVGAGDEGDFWQDSGEDPGQLRFRGCKSELDGGGLQVRGRFEQSSGSAHFVDCSAKRSGGCLNVEKGASWHGHGEFVKCKAGKKAKQKMTRL
ncbi:unnamed protein product, partial [Symbiodinium sp. CCMP2456]